MANSISSILKTEAFRPALIVPTVIMLIFSLFNLTAAPDPARSAKAINLGIVNQDDGLLFPPLNVADRVLEGLSTNLPFATQQFENVETAREALERGDIAAAIVFDKDFSKNAVGSDNFEIQILNAQHLTLAETQVAGQLGAMVQMAMSAGVSTLRLALAKGQLPSGQLPVTAKVETLHKANNTAMLGAPIVMTSVTWLAGFVGSILLFIASKDVGTSKQRSRLRTFIPIGNIGVATLVLALIVALTTQQWANFIAVWLTVWVTTLCLSWLFGGLFSIFGFLPALVILPLAFYQTAIGGAMAPTGAAPEWLQFVGNLAPFDAIGASYRGVIHGADFSIPLLWLFGAGAIGLVLIWTKTLLDRST